MPPRQISVFLMPVINCRRPRPTDSRWPWLAFPTRYTPTDRAAARSTATARRGDFRVGTTRPTDPVGGECRYRLIQFWAIFQLDFEAPTAFSCLFTTSEPRSDRPTQIRCPNEGRPFGSERPNRPILSEAAPGTPSNFELRTSHRVWCTPGWGRFGRFRGAGQDGFSCRLPP